MLTGINHKPIILDANKSPKHPQSFTPFPGISVIDNASKENNDHMSKEKSLTAHSHKVKTDKNDQSVSYNEQRK